MRQAASGAGAPLTGPLAVAAGATVAVGVTVSAHGVQAGLLFAIGIAFGATLYHSAFGFTSAYRRMI